MLELEPNQLGSLDLQDLWVPYVDLYDEPFMPTRIKLGAEEYAYNSSVPIKGHGATLPGKIRALREAGKTPLVVERDERYYIFVNAA
jgi:hypothetical protein